MTVSQIYEEAKSLPQADRVQLATLLLNHIPLQSLPGYSGVWSDEDIREATAHSYSQAAASFEEDGDA